MSNKEQLDSLHEIRDLMKRSTKFIALNGWSGVLVGLTALSGVAVFCNHFQLNFWTSLHDRNGWYELFRMEKLYIIKLGFVIFLIALMLAVIVNALEAKKKGQKAWDFSSRRLAFHLGFPLIVGAIVCLVMMQYELLLLPGASLIFYGLALVNASKYTIDGIKWLGIIECVLGIICLFNMYDSIFYWSLGFGVMHIVAGLVFQYTKK